jgi:hypothetical protein
LVLDQVRVALCPATMVVGSTPRVIVGVGGGIEELPPP